MRVADSRTKNPFEQPQLATGDQLSVVAFRVYSYFLPLLKNTTALKQPYKQTRSATSRTQCFSSLNKQYRMYLTCTASATGETDAPKSLLRR